MAYDHKISRDRMVEEQLMPRSIESAAVLGAMRSVPRHLFVPEAMRDGSYLDTPLPIGSGQTISQPYIVAYMTEQLGLAPGDKILEIGTGSGYQAAILAYLGCEVYTMEVVEPLASEAERTLAALNFGGVKVKRGNGYLGWPEEAPFDAIIVTAAPEAIPGALVEQLADGGKMIIPVGKANAVQWLKLVTKADGKAATGDLIPVRFVPMVQSAFG